MKYHRGNRNIRFQVGQHVQIRDYTDPNKPTWVPGVIDKQIDPRNYICTVASRNNKTLKRHINQIRDGMA